MRRVAIVILAVLGATTVAGPGAHAGQEGGNDGEPTIDEAPESAPKPTGDYRETIDDAIADIQEYWSEEFPDLYGDDFTPIAKKHIIAARPGVKLPACGGRRGTYADIEGNAAYVPCPDKALVVYDDHRLFPAFDREFGGLAVPLILAHEWGHVVQDQAGTIESRPIVVELQADCFAGSWLARIAAGDSPRVSIGSGNLDSALAAVLQFADPIGLTEEIDANAHGSGFDRVSALQQGFDEGTDASAVYFESEPRIVEIPFSDEQEAASGGNLPADDVIPLTVDLLNDFYSQAEPAYVPRTLDDVYSYDADKKSELPSCGEATFTAREANDRVFFCPADESFGFDAPYLGHVYADIGDFGVVALLANPFASYVQTLQEFPGVQTNEPNAVLGADCYTGGFAAAMFNGVLLIDERTGESGVALSPGDLDEAISAYVDYTLATRARADRPEDLLDVTFVRLRAFREGFFSGYQACSSYEASAEPSE